jgi:hypothetical protein
MQHDLALARAERIETLPEHGQCPITLPAGTIASEAGLDSVKKILVTERLCEELYRTALHRLHGYWHVGMGCDEDNRPLPVCGGKVALKLKTASSRHSHVEYQASPKPNGWRKHLTRILFVGQKPETVDFSDPALPPGFDAAKINAGIAVAVAKIGERGWQGDTCMITPDEAGRAMLEKTLRGAAYDCVVIGGGLRIPPRSLALFEMVVNAVHKAAPAATIALNTRPEDTAEAAARQLNPG